MFTKTKKGDPLKKTIPLVYLCCLAFASTGFAENAPQFGVVAGANLADVRGEAVENNHIKLGFVAGGFAAWEINESLRIRPEAVVSMKGTNIDMSDQLMSNDIDATATMSLLYLEVPVLASWAITQDIALLAGPAAGLYLQGELKSEISGTVDGQSVNESNTQSYDREDMSSPNFGLIVGASYQLESILIEGRYNLGLNGIYSHEDAAEIKHSVIQLQIGYLLGS